MTEKHAPFLQEKKEDFKSLMALAAKLAGVRRVNGLPLYLILAAIMAFVIIAVSVGMDRSIQPEAAAEVVKEKQGDSSQLALAVAGTQVTGMVPAASSGTSPESTLQSTIVPIAMSDDQNSPPLSPRLQGNAIKPVNDPEITRIAQEKMQLFENAVKSKTDVPVPELKSSQRTEVLSRISDTQQQIAALQSDDPNVTFQARLAQLQNGGNSPDNTPAKLLNASGTSSNEIKQFDNNGKSNRWALDQQVEAPPTPYTLSAGFIIPATLISGINSDLPGQIIGQVSQNVYDTATGRYLLIPQGSRLVGSYSNNVAYGQSRVLIAWQRIVFPNGNTLDIGAMPGADGIGEAGFEDQVNNHYLRIFGSAILMSGITAGVSLSQDQNANSIYSQPTTSSIISQSLGQQLGTTATQMINKNLNISPTLEIRPGFRFNVMCVKDLALTKPYATLDN